MIAQQTGSKPRREKPHGNNGKATRGRLAGTPLSAGQIRDLATCYLQDMATRLLAVAEQMEKATPPIATVDVSKFGTATRGIEDLLDLVRSAELAIEDGKKPKVRDFLLRGNSKTT